MHQDYHSEPCKQLVETMKKTSEQDAYIVSLLNTSCKIEEEVSDLQKSSSTQHIENVHRFNKLEKLIIWIGVLSFMGGVVGDRIPDLIATVIRVVSVAFASDVFAGN